MLQQANHTATAAPPLLRPWRGGRLGDPTVIASSQLARVPMFRDSGWQRLQNIWGSRDGGVITLTHSPSAPPLSVAIPLRGDCLITLGLYHLRESPCRLYARLSGESHFTQVRPLRRDASFERVVLGVADVTGRSLELAVFSQQAWVDDVEFTPVISENAIKPDRDLLGILDFNVDASTSRPSEIAAASAVRRHAEVGFTTLAWKAYAVRCEYWTDVGERRAPQPKEWPDGPSLGELLLREDTLRSAVEEAKRLAIPLLGWVRISNEMDKPAPHPFSPTTPFHLAHPGMRQRRRDGQPTPRLSLAFPEVRRHKAQILAEIVARGVDGLFIDTLRHPPMALFDEPLVERYMTETGDDPCRMEGDGREHWLRFRARHAFTQFLIEARELIEATAGRGVPIYVRVLDQPWANLVAGCDITDWLERGLVQGLVAAPWIAEAHDYPEAIDVKPYVSEAAGRARVWSQVWRYGSMAQALELAKQAYDAGAQGVAVFDSELAILRPNCREGLWRLAHRGLGF
jgi:hypothetical protein